MPSTTSTLPSGNTVRVKKTVIAKTLTDSAASSIGLANYYHRYVKHLLFRQLTVTGMKLDCFVVV